MAKFSSLFLIDRVSQYIKMAKIFFLVTVTIYFQSEERLSVYLEYVSGGSIHKLLQEYGAFAEPVIQNYTRQILSGLAYLHGRNTVHRSATSLFLVIEILCFYLTWQCSKYHHLSAEISKEQTF